MSALLSFVVAGLGFYVWYRLAKTRPEDLFSRSEGPLPKPDLPAVPTYYDVPAYYDPQPVGIITPTIDSLIEELIQIGRLDQFLSNRRVREIGTIIDSEGGMDLMRFAHDRVHRKLGGEPPRVCRRLFGLSQAAILSSSRLA
jgi:hypothetical protein